MWLEPRLHPQRAQCVEDHEDLYTMERQYQRQPNQQLLVAYNQTPSPQQRCSPHIKKAHRHQQDLDEITIDTEYPLATSTMSKKISTGATRRGIDTHMHQYNMGPSPMHHHPQLNFPPPPAYPPPLSRQRPYRYSVNESREALALSEGVANTNSISNNPGPSGRSAKIYDHQEGAWGIQDEDKVTLGPIEYSYAYYEPGPARRHSNVPNKYPAHNDEVLVAYEDEEPSTSTGHRNHNNQFKGGSYRARHTYLTRLGFLLFYIM